MLAAGALLAVVALGALAYVFSSSSASLAADDVALARVSMPIGGGTIRSVVVVAGPHSARIPVELRDHKLWPTRKIAAGQRVEVDVTVSRPGWISWLSGATQHLRLALTAPAASLRSHYVTLRRGRPLELRFRQPVRTVAYGQPGHLTHRTLPTPQSSVTLAHSGIAGTIYMNATIRTWESARTTQVSWFPAGGAATAVASPAPGTQISSHTPITLTFSKPVTKALGSSMPPVTPAGAGSWQQTGSHAITFSPTGYGYGLGAHVSVALPSGVRLVGGQSGSGASGGSWIVPPGSTLRLQQLLSLLGYLPFRVHYAGGQGIPTTPEAQEAAAVKPPAARFRWRYPNVPSALRSMWAPGTSGTMTRGALMAFENNNGMTADGVAGPGVWKALIAAVDSGKGASTAGYTFVMVDKNSSPESLRLWHSGRISVTAPVNTGIASAPTASGTYPVFEHIPVTTMSGTNPDGSHYSDPGIQYVSYFNGGDALHAFTRAQYGSPQSLGCVEMTLGDAASVYPYTPIGTLVNVS
jgi:peptidoglycan hydrolase-like protein with peptidoglycan-binding domain